MTTGERCHLIPCGEDGFPLSPDTPAIPDDLAEICRASAEHTRKVGYAPPWTGYLLARDGTWLGGGAFVAPPEGGRVEIAYFTLPAHEGRGFGRTTATLLVEIARRADPTLTLWAKTLPEENASTAILRSLGFRHVGSTIDHEIGEAWAWVLEPEPS
jgi:[ribosomal protein S5]-alanine N-acetyltransferase